ncbi:unnamed protein product [Blepharisma stoltei]|uniref:Uncharacterized protein n=1 Tax=Blepharisma stoltei TaxID=1481888 RepID=A0AAU9J948_9CILI|nr:unnamed protein product [Blepharisma stoltei]
MGFLTKFILSRVVNGFYGSTKKGLSSLYDPNNGMWIAGALSKLRESKFKADQDAQKKFTDSLYDQSMKEVFKQAVPKLEQQHK